MRRASAETERAARDLAAAEKRVAFFHRSKASGSDNYAGFVASGLVAEAEARLKVAKRVHAAAERQMAATRVLYVEQKREVRALAAGIAGATTPLRTVAAAETALAAAAARPTPPSPGSRRCSRSPRRGPPPSLAATATSPPG